MFKENDRLVITQKDAIELLKALDNVLMDQDFVLEGLLHENEEILPECLEANQVLHDFEEELYGLLPLGEKHNA